MYLISTKFGMIPNICTGIDNIISLNRDRILYIDDFVFEDSIFYKKEISLRDFCNIPNHIKIYLMFKTNKNFKNGKLRTINSKRGDKKIGKEEYEKILKILDPDFYQDFDVQNTVVSKNGEKIIVKDIKNIKDLDTRDTSLISTNFINEMTDNGLMLKIQNDQLDVAEEVYDCECCGNLSKGYLLHLKKMKEINFFYYLTIHNYNTLYKFLEGK